MEKIFFDVANICTNKKKNVLNLIKQIINLQKGGKKATTL